MRKDSLVFCLVLASSCFAGDGGALAVHPPAARLVHDRMENALRLMVGVPGAAYVGEALLSGVDDASLSPDGARAIVRSHGALQFVRAAGVELTAAELAAGASRLSAGWAPDSRTAAVYDASAATLRFLSVREENWAWTAEMPAGLPEGEVTGIVCHPRRSAAIVALRHPVHGGVYAVSEAGTTPLALVPEPRSLRLTAGADAAYFLGGAGAPQIFSVRHPFLAPLAEDPLPLSGMEAAGLVIDERAGRLVAAGGNTVRIFHRASRALIEERSLDFVAASLDQTGDAYLLAPRTGPREPFLFLPAGADATVFFVPVFSPEK